MLTKPTLKDIYAPIAKELDQFSARLQSELSSKDPLISQIHAHLLKMIGKFLRPALAILSSKIGGKSADTDVTRLAVAIELIHTATLVHDDIIDGSSFRRDQPSVHSKWGQELSIVAGDYLYAKAFMLFSSFQDVWMSRAFAQCAHRICEGEMKQIEKRRDFLMNEEEYLQIIRQKTAVLFQAACIGGSHLAGNPLESTEKLGNYGLSLGLAFQITDDCLDLTGETEGLGKSAGLDLSQCDVTLPLLYLFQDLGAGEREALLDGIRQKDARLAPKIRSMAVERKSIVKAMDRARHFADEANREIEDLPPSLYKESLQALAQHCVDRAR